jgi:hypothetical protein
MPLEDEPNPSSGWHLIHIAQGGEKKNSADVKKRKNFNRTNTIRDRCVYWENVKRCPNCDEVNSASACGVKLSLLVEDLLQ